MNMLKNLWKSKDVEFRLRLTQVLLPLALVFIALLFELYEHIILHGEGIFSQSFLFEIVFFAILGPMVVFVALGWFRAQWRQRAEAEAVVRHMYQELLDAQAELKRLHALRGKLLQKLITAQEAERSRVAREIHDELGQMLTRLSLNLKIWEEHLPENDSVTHRHLEESLTLLRQTQDQAHRLIQDLRPAVLDDLGLEAALRDEVHQRLAPLGIAASVTTHGQIGRLPDEVAIAVFRIVRESISNVIRHANANHVHIGLTCNTNALEVSVVDDGIGVPLDVFNGDDGYRPFGLLGMQERAMALDGQIRIVPRDPKGTQVTLWVPLPKS